jgi:hypothetical protein
LGKARIAAGIAHAVRWLDCPAGLLLKVAWGNVGSLALAPY